MSRKPGQQLLLLQERVQHGVMPELVDLARIKGVKGYRARCLFKHGFRTVSEVAKADISKLEASLGKGESLFPRMTKSGKYIPECGMTDRISQ